ncbi:FkbM family methyltransferase [Phaeobacter sp. B1627]|uniref:FkbM family methyltransferase n=1 Tax=Phaeobacter sp. B1627 TaxID=2583809 RepID=UPI0011192326|nr:FkbM family methyltransferase [Phaeobacter sp. B1627]TNJ40657.1 FkbM family methyltransferase [Phaeobacter sp. B1627]
MDFDPAKLAEFTGRMVAGEPVGFPGLDLHACDISGRRFVFAVDMKRDPIQRALREGKFYEEEELSLVKSIFPFGGTFVDIGANVGNHSLYVASFLTAAKVIPFEPNPKALKLLLANIAMNGLTDRFDLSHLGQGVARSPGTGFGIEDRNRNLGAARMRAGEGEIRVTTGDIALVNDAPDFIKIDVEGMEIDVLCGLRETIARCQPALLVEVDRDNDTAFHALLDEIGYCVVQTLQHYRQNKNYVVKPRPDDAAGQG